MNGIGDTSYTTFPYWAFENAFRLTWCDHLPIENLLPSGSKQSRSELKETEGKLRAIEHREHLLAMDFANPDEDIEEVKEGRAILKEEKVKLIAKRNRLRAELGENPQERMEAVRLWFNKIVEMKKKDEIDEARLRMKSLLADIVERVEVKLEAKSRHDRSAVAKVFLRGGEKPFKIAISIYREESQTIFDIFVYRDKDPMHGFSSEGSKWTRERYNVSEPKPVPMEEDPFFAGLFETDPKTGKVIKDPKTGEPKIAWDKKKEKATHITTIPFHPHNATQRIRQLSGRAPLPPIPTPSAPHGKSRLFIRLGKMMRGGARVVKLQRCNFPTASPVPAAKADQVVPASRAVQNPLSTGRSRKTLSSPMENGSCAAQLLGTEVAETTDGPSYSSTRRFGAVLRHAAIRACLTVAAFASRSCMIVDPRRHHAPLAGRKMSGSERMKDACSSGFSLTIPQSSSGPSVAKILPLTRKSGWPMCADSDTSGRLRARLRNLSAVIPTSYPMSHANRPAARL